MTDQDTHPRDDELEGSPVPDPEEGGDAEDVPEAD